jgi:hypothetical protein
MLVALMTRCLIAIQLALFPLLLSTGAPKTTLLLIVWLRQMWFETHGRASSVRVPATA